MTKYNSPPSHDATIELERPKFGSRLADDDTLLNLFRSKLPEVQDFPIKGIKFKDIAPFLGSKGAISRCSSVMADMVEDLRIDKILAIDARGFILGAALSDRLQSGFVMVRKPGKLPGAVKRFDYTCEYRTGALEVSCGMIRPGDRCLVLDDLLATGGTARATADHAKAEGAEVVGFSFMIEITALGGRERLREGPVATLFQC